jgi:hypothetical protein
MCSIDVRVVHLRGNKMTCTSLNLKSTGPSQLGTWAYNMYWWLLPEPKYLYRRWHIGAVVGCHTPNGQKGVVPPAQLYAGAHGSKRLYIQSVNISAVQRRYTMQKKLKYASYTMGGCSDTAVDIKMDGQDKINHSCKVYRSFFGWVQGNRKLWVLYLCASRPFARSQFNWSEKRTQMH